MTTPSFARRNERMPAWGDPLPRPWWSEALRCAGFLALLAAGWVLALHVAIGRGL